ncbi:MAG: RNA methyltransferase [Chitinophagales bacterium]|nr:RNA methyltransferase [Chitinophagales bacterium]MDW8393362.1 RNA methyltransferase [Chitinophagales bacterium]
MTEQRQQRFREVLQRRQRDLTVVFENVDDPHNVAACLRSCDAVGISDVFILNSKGKTQSRLSEKTSASAARWLSLHHHQDVVACMQQVRQRYGRVLAAAINPQAVSLFEVDFLPPTAIVFGNEKDGISQPLLASCDGLIHIPQVGMIQSLNISVACAVILYEAFRQRRQAGYYQRPPDPVWMEETFSYWLLRDQKR